MDFIFSTEADDAAELAARIVAAEVTPARLKAVDVAAAEGGARFDTALWGKLTEAGLVSLTVPESYGGAGLGLIEAGRVLTEVGRAVSPVPATPHVAALTVLAESGAASLLDAVLPEAVAGRAIVAVATGEEHELAPTHPDVTASRDGDDWGLTGTKSVVRGGTVAHGWLVTASTDTGVGVFLVCDDDPGVTVTEQLLMDGDRAGVLTLSDTRVPGDRLIGSADGSTAKRLTQVHDVLTCAEQLGVTEGALALTSSYAKEREQFGRPIGSFQAVAQRLADGFIDTLGQRMTLWQALWRLSEGLPADVEVATAKLWAADAGHRLAHTTVHVHGGNGIDLDGTAHRYFTAAKRLEFAVGGATSQALEIGATLAVTA
ncbi:acyl-CoA dehydrogenase family protein [Nocardioides sp. Kera G14]|uniref:acyl-CoA dehydrogenase family protein n=1 Tax=Nocardioides sp. Kera G14 TaxID=2884264 RepID=UPI001D10FFF3|nr:acyl-CoA dehydrogenase family protein [Nocardioides sp. Kera G14]UDY22209.1 acyl-CoA/acyl-ACP dehydrogenase [Nocardioides sp. Kera G14]